MATIDLGKIKFVNRGAYNNSTAYTPDDVVTSGGSSYICKLASTGNAVTNGTYWDVLAQAGTDLGTTLTTQGDILYRDGSGLQRLAKPASDKILQNTSGGVLSWITAPSGVVKKIEQFTNNTRASLSSTTAKTVMWNSSFTTTTASSKVLIQVLIAKLGSAAGGFNCGIEWNGTNYDGTVHYTYENSDNYATMHAQYVFDSPGTPGSVNWAVYYDSANSSASRPGLIFNPNSSDDGRLQQTISSLIITEFKNS